MFQKIQNKIISQIHFEELRSDIAADETIVFTNGCFDILHPGHVDYLYRTATYGDILVVGINSDNSVQKIKGIERPVNNEKSRAFVLAGLGCVDYVIIFDEPTPYNLIATVQPDVLIKGGDWPVEKIAGRDIVMKKSGKVYSIKTLDDHSTTAIINRIKSLS
jgi:rfaE bifunctional protein nucleotidyltransferase chain/domain